jgi:hypothetical protein
MSTFVRSIAISLFFPAIIACHRKVEVCARCHMTITPGDLHTTVIVWNDGSNSKFDSATCATSLWQIPPTGLTPSQMLVHEYYSGTSLDASKIVFVQKSDVKGPMGDEYVAVDPANLKKFQTDHGGTTFTLNQMTISHEPDLER